MTATPAGKCSFPGDGFDFATPSRSVHLTFPVSQWRLSTWKYPIWVSWYTLKLDWVSTFTSRWPGTPGDLATLHGRRARRQQVFKPWAGPTARSCSKCPCQCVLAWQEYLDSSIDIQVAPSDQRFKLRGRIVSGRRWYYMPAPAIACKGPTAASSCCQNLC